MDALSLSFPSVIFYLALVASIFVKEEAEAGFNACFLDLMSAINGTSHGMPVNIIRGTHEELIIWIVLNMWPSHFGLPVLVSIVLFSKRVKRHATFVNLCVTLIITGISSSLLVYAGRTTGPEPSRMLCLLQASLLYGMPPLTSTAAFSLVLQMFFTIKASYDGVEYVEQDHLPRLWAMIVGPYVAYLIVVLATAIVGAANPLKVNRNRRFFYCSVEANNLTDTLTMFSAVVLVATLTMIAWTMSLLYRRIKLARKHIPRARWTVDLNFPYRIMAFALYLIVALSLSLLSIQSPSSPVPDLAIATAATVSVIIFGTQADILRVIFFWRSPAIPVAPTYEVDLKVAFEGGRKQTGQDKPLPDPPKNITV